MAYNELVHDTNTTGHIPWTVIKEFATINMLDFNVLLHCIRVMENIFKEKNSGTK